MLEGSAHVGGHVTLIFSVHDDFEKLVDQGSRGAGFSLDTGIQIIACGISGSGKVSVDGYPSDITLHQLVIEEISIFDPDVKSFDWNLKQQTRLPHSQGFGLSAAGAIASALAIQRAMNISEKIARAQSLHIAHRVERKLSGGLGDVAALYAGGVELRIEPGCPPLLQELGGGGAIVSWFSEIPVVVCWRKSASQHTSNYIDDGEWKLAIRAAGEAAISGLREGVWESVRWGELLDEAANFSKNSGLLDDSNRIDLLHQVGGAMISSGLVNSSLAARLCMLGESVVILPNDIKNTDFVNWQSILVESLEQRGLGALAVNISDDALNLQILSPN
ncbi:MAG: hypothetical protein QF440_05995 [Candidatus Thalassarchaeaceae archaeon]|mgnify:CR=1 FL=1|nr:hypothetical protein [Candidatus Thalassarchaeaceae archaeon]